MSASAEDVRANPAYPVLVLWLTTEIRGMVEEMARKQGPYRDLVRFPNEEATGEIMVEAFTEAMRVFLRERQNRLARKKK